MRTLTVFIFFNLLHCYIFSQTVPLFTQLGLKGNVKKVIEKEYYCEKNLQDIEATILVSKYSIQFYENNKVKNETFLHQGKAIQKNYSINGILESLYYEFSEDGKPELIDSFFYLQNGFIDKKIVFHFDNNGRYSPKKVYVPIQVYQYKYDEFFNIISIKHGYYDKKDFGFNGINPLLDPKIFNSNIEGLNESIWDEIPANETVSKNIETYDKTTNTSFRYSESFEEANFQYSYDNKNNWIKRISFSGSKPIRIQTRDILYY